MDRLIIVGGVYRHFKGLKAHVLNLAKHSETLEDMIVYQSTNTDATWVRPKSMWNDIVDTKNNTLRFTLC